MLHGGKAPFAVGPPTSRHKAQQGDMRKKGIEANIEMNRTGLVTLKIRFKDSCLHRNAKRYHLFMATAWPHSDVQNKDVL